MSNSQKNTPFSLLERPISQSDPEIFTPIQRELARQQDTLQLIASENFVSQAVLDAQGSILTNKYAEGYPGRRYYGGCEHVDVIENIAIERAKKLFNAGFANVQPHSGSQANQAVFLALLQPHDKILGLSLDCGGHLTHGSQVNLSGKWFSALQYGVHQSSGKIDYAAIETLAQAERPKLIIAGFSSYPRQLDFARFRSIADSVGAYLLVDMAHFAGLVACGLYPDPLPHADVVTSTTHKTLRGPRGGLILTNHAHIAKAINSAVFPGIQGGPLMHVIAAKAVAFKEALSEEFHDYMKKVKQNAQIMAETLMQRGYQIFTGGTDCHLLLVDLASHNISGALAQEQLDSVGITCNKNTIPFDKTKPNVTSGIRLGTPAITTRGLGAAESRRVGELIATTLDSIDKSDYLAIKKVIQDEVRDICMKFPIYSNLN